MGGGVKELKQAGGLCTIKMDSGDVRQSQQRREAVVVS